MSIDGLEQLKSLSVSVKVSQMLKNHLDVDHPDLVEFIIHLAKNAKNVQEFSRILDENDAEVTAEFAEQLYGVIIALDPPKGSKDKPENSWDSIINAETDDSVLFPALALKNSERTREELLEPEKRNDGELSEWARRLLERENVEADVGIAKSKNYKANNYWDKYQDGGLKKSRNCDREKHRDAGMEFDRNRNRSTEIDRNKANSMGRRYKSDDRIHQFKNQECEFTKLERFGVYKGRVTHLMDFGAFVSFRTLNGMKQGLLHASEITSGRRRILDVSKILQVDMPVFVKVIAIVGEKIDLSMKDVDQDTGEDLGSRVSSRGAEFHKDAIVGNTGLITGVSLDDYVHGVDGKKRKLLGDLERWEQQQLLNSGVLGKEEKADMEILMEDRVTEEVIEIEVNDACPTFLKGQTIRSGIELSPIKIVSNPEGSLARTIATSATMARERKAIEKAQEDAFINSVPRDVSTPWEDPNPLPGERTFVQSLRCLGAMRYQIPEWKRQSLEKSVGYGKKPETFSIKEQRESLPIYELRESLLQAVKDNEILIVVGETGSGKSTQIPQYLAEVGYVHGENNKIKMIGCTQPRRVAAMSVAKRVAEEVGCILGHEVGYCIRFEDCTTKDTIIKFMTDGMLLREVLQDPLLEGYSVIMLDEAHERTIATDVLFALLKECCSKRRDFKLIVTSATLEAEKFSAYFNNSAIFSIPGRTFPVEILHAKEQESDYLEASLITVLNIHLNEHAGDILLFLTGQDEIDVACRTLHDRMKKLGSMSPPPLIVLPVYAALPSEMQIAIFEPTPPGCRKCVVATNIAEASLTIDGIYFVIDPGFAKVKHYNPRTGMESLAVVPISQASAKQRAGRAGRTGPGKCYRLYTEAAYRLEMLPTAVPEIQRTNLANVVILLKAMGINDFINFDFMDKPPVETLIDALDNLYHLGALDDDGLLTRVGRKMAEFPMDPNLAKMLLTSVDLGCSDEIITIVSMLSIQNVFYRPQDKQAEADRAKAKFLQAEGDHLTYLQVYTSWQRNKFSSLWCHENFVQGRALTRAQDIRKQLISIMDRYKFRITSSGQNPERIAKAVCSGFFHHSAKRDPQTGYRTILDHQQVYIHPSSALYNRSPEYVVFHELVMTSKEYMRDLTVVKPQWLLELAPSMFKKADGATISKGKQREKIEPLFNKFEEKDAWRLSRRRG